MLVIANYKDLKVWQKGRTLVKDVYTLSQPFPETERWGLTSQLRRAIISVPSNIAEGHSRSGTNDYIRFLSIAIGSLAEVETQLILACDLGYSSDAETSSILDSVAELQRMLHALRRNLRATSNP